VFRAHVAKNDKSPKPRTVATTKTTNQAFNYIPKSTEKDQEKESHHSHVRHEHGKLFIFDKTILFFAWNVWVRLTQIPLPIAALCLTPFLWSTEQGFARGNNQFWFIICMTKNEMMLLMVKNADAHCPQNKHEDSETRQMAVLGRGERPKNWNCLLHHDS
jgi:hypothetical protein